MKLIGTVKESDNVTTKFDDAFEMDLSYFEDEAVFRQEVSGEGVINGELMYMVCNGTMCLAPAYVDMEFRVE